MWTNPQFPHIMLNLLVRKQVLITQTKWKRVGLLLNSLHTEFLHVLYFNSFIVYNSYWQQFVFDSEAATRGVLKNFAKFTGKDLTWHRYFPVNLVKFLRTPFLQATASVDLTLNRSRNEISEVPEELRSYFWDETINCL